MNKTNTTKKVYIVPIIAIIIIIIFWITIISLVVSFSNDTHHYTTDDLPALKESAKNFTLSYIENKYDFVPEIIDIKSDTYNESFDGGNYPSGIFLLTCSDDNREFIVRYSKLYSLHPFEYAEDNYQQKEITEDIYSYYANEIGKEPARYYISYGITDYNYNHDNNERPYFIEKYYDGNNLKELLEYESASCIFEYIEDIPNISRLNNSDN